MKGYDVARTIQAAPERVWEVVTNAAGYTSWDSGVERVEGTITAGGKIKVFSEVSPGRAFPVRVDLDAPRQMTWTGGMPLGLFKGVRTFTLAPTSNGATEFRMKEEFTGPLLGLIWRTMPDLTETFERFASGLKETAEAS